MTENQIKIRPTLTDMEIGDTCTFPVARMRSVRAQASELGVILDRTYKTTTNRAERTISVTRTS